MSYSEWLIPVVSILLPPLTNIVSKSLNPSFCQWVVGVHRQDDMLILVLVIIAQSEHLVTECEVGEGGLVGAEEEGLVLCEMILDILEALR